MNVCEDLSVFIPEFKMPDHDAHFQLDAMRKLYDASRRDLRKTMVSKEDLQDQLTKVRGLLLAALREKDTAVRDLKRAHVSDGADFTLKTEAEISSERFAMLQRAAAAANRERNELEWRCAKAEELAAELKSKIGVHEVTRSILVHERDVLTKKSTASEQTVSQLKTQTQNDRAQWTRERETFEAHVTELKLNTETLLLDLTFQRQTEKAQWIAERDALTSDVAALKQRAEMAEAALTTAVHDCKSVEQRLAASEMRVAEVAAQLRTARDTREKSDRDTEAAELHQRDVGRTLASMKEQIAKLSARLSAANKVHETDLKARDEIEDQRWALEVQLSDAHKSVQAAQSAQALALKERADSVSAQNTLRDRVKELELQLAELEEARVRTLRRAVTAITQRKTMEAALAGQAAAAS